MVPLAHGNDGGGSIRMPASCCGLFGLKPTRGRTPVGPDVGEAFQGLSCDHVLTRSVRDSAAMLDATAGPDVGAPYAAAPPERPFLEEAGMLPGKLRIAYTPTSFMSDYVHEDCTKGLEATVQLCRELGHEVVETALQIDGQTFAIAYLTLIFGETAAIIEDGEAYFGRKATYQDFEPATWTIGLLGHQFTAAEFAKATRFLKGLARPVGHFFEDYDLFLTPTLAMPPVVTGSLKPKAIELLAMKALGRLKAGKLLRVFGRIDQTAGQIFRFMPYTPLANVTGQPAMSVPLYWNDDELPIGIHFMARFGDESTLFRLASQLEQAQPWSNRLPPLLR